MRPAAPRSSAARIPRARSSTWTNPSPTPPSADERERAGIGLGELPADRRVVARTVDLRGHGRSRPARRPRCAAPPPVGAPLRLVVVAHEPVRRVAPVGLVDGRAVRVAEDVDRRDVDDPRDPAAMAASSDRAPSCRRWCPPSPGARPPRSRSGRSRPRGSPRRPRPAPRQDRGRLGRSFVTSVRPGAAARLDLPGSRTSATTSSPRARSCRTIAPPTNPAAAGDRDAQFSRPACRSRPLRGPP